MVRFPFTKTRKAGEREGERDKLGVWDSQTPIHKINKQQGFTV